MPSILVTPRCSDGWSVLLSSTFFMMKMICSMNCVLMSDTITCNKHMYIYLVTMAATLHLYMFTETRQLFTNAF